MVCAKTLIVFYALTILVDWTEESITGVKRGDCMTNDVILHQLDAVIFAYDEGLKKKKRTFESKNIISLAIKKYMSGNDIEHIQNFQDLQTRAITVARVGKYSEADSVLKQAEIILRLCSLSSNANSICLTLYEAAAAYIDYRRGLFDTALKHLFKALEIDCILEKQQEFVCFHLHRLQVTLNIMRIHMRRNNTVDALKIGFGILDYLEGKCSTFPINASKDDMFDLSIFPDEILSLTFDNAVAEIAYIVAANDRDSMYYVPFIDQHFEHSCFLAPGGHNWLQMKQLHLNNEYLKFILQVSHILKAGPGPIPFLWNATVIEFLAFCTSCHEDHAKTVGSYIANSISTWDWKQLPSSWKEIVVKI